MNLLAWPLRPPTLAWLAGLSLAAIVVEWFSGGIIGMALAGLWWLMAFKLASEALTVVAAGREGDAGFENFASDGVAVRQVFLGLGLLVGGVLAMVFGGAMVLALYCGVLVLVLPAIVVVLVMEESLWRAFDPRTWLELWRRVGSDYVVVAAQVAALATAVGLAIVFVVAPLPAWLGAAASHFLLLYLLLASYHALGALLDRHRDDLDLERKQPIVRPLQGTPEEAAAVAEAERLIDADRPAPAAAVLDRLIRGRGATAPTHTRYRLLLAQLGDREGLLRHARHYVAVLLHLRQEREALALYLESRGMDPAFELDDPQPVSELIALAARNQQSQLAVGLYEEFARRFPRDRDLVPNGLAAARLMDRLDRDDDARRLLHDLLQRFPEHELRPQLETALQAIRPGSAAL